MKIADGRWSNWSGAVRFRPRAIAMPKDREELAAVLRASPGPVRVPGAGHSFTPLNVTDGSLVDLSAFDGLLGLDRAQGVAQFGAATPLWKIGPLLHQAGFGLRNQGDIDRQTLGGVVGTGTHGTGAGLGSFSADVMGFTLMLADGGVIRCSPSENADVFEAGRLSLGLFGVMLEISIAVRPAYKLVERQFLLSSDDLFAQLDELIASNRHFEFFWFPYADHAVCKTLNETEEPAPTPRSSEELYRRGEAMGSQARIFASVNQLLPLAPCLLKPAHRFFSRMMPGPPRVRWSHEMFPSPRVIRFNEMEYAVSLAKGPDCLREILSAIRRNRIVTGYPIEYRSVAADDVWLSPFYKRASATLAVHQYHRVDTTELFKHSEAIFRAFECRPHWGKRHTASAVELAKLYPEFERFRALRRRLDPAGKFLNPYLRDLFG